MKATIEIPDELYRQVKAKSVLQGRTVRDVTQELYRRWLAENLSEATSRMTPEQWLENWIRLADESMKDASPGPTARELLEDARNRLERR